MSQRKLPQQMSRQRSKTVAFQATEQKEKSALPAWSWSEQARTLVFISLRLALAGLFTYGAATLLLPVLNMPVLQPGPAILLIAAMQISLAMLTWTRYNWLLTLGLLIIGGPLAWLLVPGLPRYFASWQAWLGNLISQTLLFARGQTGADTRSLAILAALTTAGLGLFAYLLIARFASAWPVLLATLAIGLARAITGLKEWTPWLLVCLGLSLTLLARSQPYLRQRLGRRRKASGPVQLTVLAAGPVLAIILVATLLVQQLPGQWLYQRDLAGLVSDVAKLVRSQFQPAETPAEAFNLASAGYYPLVERLGGSVQPGSTALFAMSGERRALLLRAAVSEVYDGWRWYRQPMDYAWRYDSLFSSQVQQDVFDLNRPDLRGNPQPGGAWLASATYTITPARPQSVVLLAGRPLAIDAPFDLYFNIAGALYPGPEKSTRQPYTVEARLLDPMQDDFRRQLAWLTSHDRGTALESAQRQAYLQLPELDAYGPDGRLTRLVDRLLPAGQPAWDQVQRLVQYLQKRCSYSLTVAEPPAEREFVSWFLDSREGYCVYFATALTMLCRLADIPARYVEGYVAPAAVSGRDQRVISGNQAHAWTEIWLDELGWVPVDPTPGIGTLDLSADLHLSPTPIPTVTPAPTVRPTVSESSRAATQSPAGPSDKTHVPVTGDQRPWLAILILLVLVLLAGALGILGWRYRNWYLSHRPGWVLSRYPDHTARYQYYWQQITGLGQLLGLPLRPEHTIRQYMVDLQQICQRSSQAISGDNMRANTRDNMRANTRDNMRDNKLTDGKPEPGWLQPAFWMICTETLEQAFYGPPEPASAESTDFASPAGPAMVARLYDELEALTRRTLPAWRFWYHCLLSGMMMHEKST